MKKLSLSNATKTLVWNTLKIACVALPLFAGAPNTQAGQEHEDWQTKRLLHPTERQRASEQQGHVFIYDNLNEQVIDRAMDHEFNRIGSMMFINVKNKKKVKVISRQPMVAQMMMTTAEY